MQAVDITGLTEKQVEELDKNPVKMTVDKNGIAHPDVKTIAYKGNAYSDNLVKKYPNAIKVQPDGKVKLIPSKLPWEEQLRRMVRRKGDSRLNWMAQCSQKKCLRILDNLPGTDYKLATKKELTRQLNKFCDVKKPKAKSQKKRDEARKLSKKKSHKEHKEEESAELK